MRRSAAPLAVVAVAAALAVAALAIASLACAGDDDLHPDAEAPPADAPAADATADGATPPDPADPAVADAPIEPVSSRTSIPSGEQRIVAPGLSFSLPADWRRATPTSSMRLAQASIPGPAGDGELMVFYFGPGGGGGLEANLQRWVDQVAPDAGSTPLRDSFRAGDLTVTWIDVAGTLQPSNMGAGPAAPQPGSRLLGAVVEGPRGPWFFKATGPADTLAAERAAFVDMLKSATATP